VEMG